MRSQEAAYDDPVQCQVCGHVAERGWLSSGAYQRQTLRAICHLAPGDCEPAEHVARCPVCGAIEAFGIAVTCCECMSYPCICSHGSAAGRRP